MLQTKRFANLTLRWASPTAKVVARQALLFALWFLYPLPFSNGADEVSLFDSKGEPKAYIAEDLTVYLWDGNPVAYLFSSLGKTSIYSFDGTHLGWLERGIIRDHDGNGVGFVRGAVRTITSIEPIKGIKSIKPIKSIREIAPIMPIFSANWSGSPLGIFLTTGATSNTSNPLSTLSNAPSPSSRAECESGHWIESVSGDGKILKLEDGSIWKVNDIDAVTSSIWLPISDVLVCGAKIINVDDGESVEASLLSSGSAAGRRSPSQGVRNYVIQASSNDETFVINGNIFKAKTYCFRMEKGDKVIFVSGSPLGVCISAEILNLRTDKICRVWCE